MSDELQEIIGFLPGNIVSGKIRISGKDIDFLHKHGPINRWNDLGVAGKVLQSPMYIFQNLKRENQSKGLCYVGKPDQTVDWSDDPTPRNSVFTVFLNSDLILFEWRWELEDEKMSGYPRDWKKRFGKLIWSACQT